MGWCHEESGRYFKHISLTRLCLRAYYEEGVSFAHADGGPDNPGYLTLKSVATAIDDASHLNEGLTNGNNQYFGIDGTRLSHQRSGLNLVRQADGTVRKVLVK